MEIDYYKIYLVAYSGRIGGMGLACSNYSEWKANSTEDYEAFSLGLYDAVNDKPPMAKALFNHEWEQRHPKGVE